MENKDASNWNQSVYSNTELTKQKKASKQLNQQRRNIAAQQKLDTRKQMHQTMTDNANRFNDVLEQFDSKPKSP